MNHPKKQSDNARVEHVANRYQECLDELESRGALRVRTGIKGGSLEAAEASQGS